MRGLKNLNSVDIWHKATSIEQGRYSVVIDLQE